MLKYEINGLVSEMKSEPKEITVNEFIAITAIQSSPDGIMEQYLNTFELLGLSEEFIELLDADAMFGIIKDFNGSFELNVTEHQKEIVVEGKTYVAYTSDEFKLGARTLATIESQFEKKDWVSYALAVIFKDESLSALESKNNFHIKMKQKLFGNLTLDVALPYIYSVSSSYIDNVKILAYE